MEVTLAQCFICDEPRIKFMKRDGTIVKFSMRTIKPCPSNPDQTDKLFNHYQPKNFMCYCGYCNSKYRICKYCAPQQHLAKTIEISKIKKSYEDFQKQGKMINFMKKTNVEKDQTIENLNQKMRQMQQPTFIAKQSISDSREQELMSIIDKKQKLIDGQQNDIIRQQKIIDEQNSRLRSMNQTTQKIIDEQNINLEFLKTTTFVLGCFGFVMLVLYYYK